MSRSELTMREVLLADMYEEKIDRLTAELERYKQGVEIRVGRYDFVDIEDIARNMNGLSFRVLVMRDEV